ncbi:hypothetical protein BOW53_08620 [Solemya pervernicosa gill symbiont]|uniref:cyclic-guanylate-specific phosphodiesterase n=2 Tax=Gammaproteobacteria incertae sedis TaxID=118884 RepID=A0A1T2L575_9GAMM|nr:EAL domain-containing protein [Candidatus Reidiella endopervernicosa]OOZ40222.1 hypothetical protein BOW53_08620 [Solemya pervernicosa gill symbiont]QKQ27121.1 EAL domain-containing protein [Candidatus Reidiella endopervernicosa]
MFKVKERGRNSYQFYTEDLTHRAMQRMLLENGIRKALTDQHFVAWYQPQYDIETNQLIGMEALARWISPDRGIISPLDFIPLAEETGLILELGEQILDQVMQQVVGWHEQGLNPGRVAINVSGKQLLNGNISATVKRLLEQNRCKVEWIEIEVTEGFVMGQGEGAIEQLQELQALGVQLSIDDFGTGYSSLAYLKQLPISKLKIDKSFVDDLPHDLDDTGITRAVIALANSLGLDVIAEGVESREQADFLLQEGCPLAQGYLYSKPLPADKITTLLKNG